MSGIQCSDSTTKTPQSPNSRAARLGASLLLAGASLALVSAAPPESGLEGLGREVPDAELADMRGKFVRADSVHFFGVELVQSWTDADGVTLQATLLFNVDFANGAGNPDGATPSIQISWNRICSVCADPSMDLSSLQGDSELASADPAPTPILTIGKFGSLEGLVQTQEIAGSNNDVLNSLNLAVVPSASIQSLPMDEAPSIAAGATEITQDGDIIQFDVARNQLGIAMTRGEDSVTQGVNGDLNQLSQHVALQSSLNTIRNEMAITVGVNDLATVNQHNIQTALSAMKGRGM